MVRKVGFLLALFSTVAFAATLPISAPVTGQVGFDTMDTAALAAEETIVNQNQSTEMAGAIYELNDKFYFTAPAGNSIHDEFAVQMEFPVGSKLVAIFHDHPWADSLSYVFSDTDVRVANQLHVTSYVGVLALHHIIKYVPGVSPVQPLYVTDWMHSPKVSAGTVIAQL